MKYNSVLPGIGLYKVEFRILEIRISGETNLKMHFLLGNWIQKNLLKCRQNVKSHPIMQFQAT